MKVLKNFAIILLSVSIAMPVFAGEKKGKVKLPSLYKSYVEVTGEFDGNRVRNDMENNGLIVSDFSGHSGMEWPKENHTYSVYASSIWFAGKVDGEIRTAAGDYSAEMMPGPWGSDPGAATHKFYKVDKADLADPLSSDDFQNWPVDLGAPWVDVDGDGVYSPLPGGPDHPEFVGDQVMWYVANDGAPGSHGLFSTLPLGLEVQFTVFGFDRPDMFGDMMFFKGLAINKGGNTIEEMFIGLWSDPDLGDAGDDFVGCDTTLSLGFCWNDGVDTEYASYSGGTPAVGYDFFQGPKVESAGDTALFMGEKRPGYKNLPMSSFAKYINPDPVYFDPNDANEVYNYMQGLTAAGSPFPLSATGGSKFVHPGDPAKDTGPTDTEYVDSDLHPSSDRRFLMNSGPFTMAPGDSQEVVFGIMHAAAGTAKKSVTYLRQVDALAQLAYDIQFALPPSPAAPVVSHSTQGDEINLMWDTAQESYSITSQVDPKPIVGSIAEIVSYEAVASIAINNIYAMANTDDQKYDTLATYSASASYDYPVVILGTKSDTTYSMQKVVTYDTTFATEPSKFEFEGYNVYQYETLSGSGLRKRVATFDKANGVTDIVDRVFDVSRGEDIYVTVQPGTDSGVQNHISINKDFLNDGIPLKTNRVYYFAVTAYGYNAFGIPKVLESAPVIYAIRPSVPNKLDVGSKGGEDYSEDVAHSSGKSDGGVNVVVVDPLKVTGDDYEVYFVEQGYYYASDGNWKAGNPPGAKLLAKLSDFSDVSPSTVTAAAYVGKGEVKIDFTMKLASPNGAWADGFKLTLPAGIEIISTTAAGAFNSDGQNDTWSVKGTVDGQTVTWGNNSLSEWGAIEGGAVFTVVVKPFDPPISVDYILYDDGYAPGDDGIKDATGTIDITTLEYQTKTIVVWNVKDMTLGQDAVTLQTIVSGEDRLTGKKYASGDDAGWAKFDGLKVKVSGAPAHTLNSTSWDESDGEKSPVFSTVEVYTDVDNDGKYDFAETYKDVGLDLFPNSFETGYVSSSDENLDPSGDDYNASSNPLGGEGNGVYNSYPTGESFTDTDSDGIWDWGEPFSDLGIDGKGSKSEPGYVVRNTDPSGDDYRLKADTVLTHTFPDGEKLLVILPANPTGMEGNKTYDVGEPFTDENANDTWDDAEPFVDDNGNKAYDAGYSDNATWMNASFLGAFINWWGGQSSIAGTAYPTVELRFVPMQGFTDTNEDGLYSNKEPYTWDTLSTNAGFADMYRTWGAEWTGFNPVPYSAWNMDTEPATQLHIVQRDLDNNGQWDGVRTNNYNYIWITNVNYDGTSKFDDGDDDNDFMYHLIGLGSDMPVYYTADLNVTSNMLARGGTLTFVPAKDNIPGDVFKFSTKGAVAKAYVAEEINVWPNPYFGFNPEERNPIDQQMHFTHLPESGTYSIRIFDLAGNHVRTITDSDAGSQFAIWDLRNNFGVPVASGVYLAHVETSTGGNKILKLAVVQPEQRLDRY